MDSGMSMKRVDAILQFGSGVGDRYIKYRNEQLFAAIFHHARVAFALIVRHQSPKTRDCHGFSPLHD